MNLKQTFSNHFQAQLFQERTQEFSEIEIIRGA